MSIDYPDNNRHLIETTLEGAINQMFVRLKMGLADWDVNDTLRSALQEPDHLDKIKDLINKYDKTFDVAKASNTEIKDKYKYLYKLNKKKKD